MEDLVQWLRTQLDDDESAAHGAKGETSGRWTQFDGPPEDIVLYDKSGKLTVGQDRHIARHDPARVLRGIDAKRAILALHTQSIRDGGCQVCDVPGGRRLRPDACTTVRMLAAEYADRPGYREDWRP